MEWFNKQSKVVKIILLLIPFVNWVTEIFVRVTAVIKKQSEINVIGLILVIIFGMIIGWVDIVAILLTGKFILCE